MMERSEQTEKRGDLMSRAPGDRRGLQEGGKGGARRLRRLLAIGFAVGGFLSGMGALCLHAAGAGTASGGTAPPEAVATTPPAVVATTPPAAVATTPPAAVATTPPAAVATTPPVGNPDAPAGRAPQALPPGSPQAPPLNMPPAAAPALANLDLSAGEQGEVPPGWRVASGSGVVASEHPEGSSRSAEVRPPEKPDPRVPFGNLMRSFDAAPYRGKRIRFRAAVKVEAPRESASEAPSGAGRAQLWLRVDRAGGTLGFFDNMDDRPISDAGWRRYEIIGKVAADAEKINLGLMVHSGRAWVSAASFEVLGDLVGGDEAARPLDARGLDNLVALARLTGDVRYFHPSDQAAMADWNRFVLAAVQAVEKAAGPDELARGLTTLFLPLAPTVRVFPSGRPEPVPAEVRAAPVGATGKPRIVAWRHFGLGAMGAASGAAGGRRPQRSVYESARIDNLTADRDPDGTPSATALPEPGRPLVADLGGGVSALVPLALYAGPAGTLPAVPEGVKPREPAKPEGFLPSGSDRVTRLADVILAWNVFEHFYPYFDVVAVDWPAELRRALASAATDRDEGEFLATLQRLVAALHDGHGNVMGGETDAFSHRLPLRWEWVEERLVVTRVDPEHGAGLERGDVVLAIDGRPVAERLAALEELISAATPQWRRYRALERLALGPAGSVRLEVQHPAGARAAVSVERRALTRDSAGLEEQRPAKIADVAPGVVYLDVSRVTDEDWKGALDRLAHARGIVFDFRGYPVMSPDFLQHLTDKPIHSAQWHVPVLTRPDRREIRFLSSSWTLEPRAPHLTAKMAFVTDGRAISYAESCLGIVENYRLGEIVGGPTAGTNGNVNPFALPGGYRLTWTGMQVLKHDGSRHHGVGILPTVPAARTVAGVAAGRDEVLEKAIEVVSR
jgi:C-terminal processing protease CtpA/Prc